MSEKSTIGEMVLNAINYNNMFLEESGSQFRLKEDLSGGEADYDVYAASKKGAPKNDYPSKIWFCLTTLDFAMAVVAKNANVKNNFFSVIFGNDTVVKFEPMRKEL